MKLFKQAKSPYYYVRFKFNGKEKWISTKTSDLSKAREIAKNEYKLIRGESSIDDIFTNLQAMLSDLPQDRQDTKRQEYSRRLLRNKVVSFPIADAWQAWLDSPMKGNPGEVTIRGYSAIWKRFNEWIAKHKVKFLHEITGLNAQDYSADLWQSKVSPATYNAHIKFLRAMFNTLKLKAGLVVNPWAEMKTMEKTTQGRENFAPEELAAICSKASGSFRYMIALGIYTGMRLGDVVNLRWADIGKDSITITPLKTSRKGKKITMPIHPVLSVLLKELKVSHTGGKAANSEYLFPEDREAYNKDTGAITKRFQQFLKDCGITTQEQGGVHRRRAIVRKGFHSLRHSFVSLCAANKIPQVAIQELVGHGSPAMTELYSHADFQQKQDAINILPAFVFTDNKEKRNKKCQ